MRTLVHFVALLLHCIVAFFRSREDQTIVGLALRQQLSEHAQGRPRPRLSPLDRAFCVTLSRLWPRWKDHLVVVRPDTVARWHRDGFRRYWRSISAPGPGRPPISEETKALIIRMATENCWRARKIQAELMKLGIRVSLATVSRYVPKKERDATQHQRWMTFLRGPASLARDLLGRRNSRDQEFRDRPEADSLSKPMAKRNRGTCRRFRTSRTPRSRHRLERGPPEKVAPRVRRLLQRRACPHFHQRFASGSTRGITTL